MLCRRMVVGLCGRPGRCGFSTEKGKEEDDTMKEAQERIKQKMRKTQLSSEQLKKLVRDKVLPLPKWDEVYHPLRTIRLESKPTAYKKIFGRSRNSESLFDASRLFRFVVSYKWFLAYMTPYMFFWDLKNPWHVGMLTVLFMQGSYELFQMSGFEMMEADALYLLGDGSFAAVMPMSVHNLIAQGEKPAEIVQMLKEKHRGRVILQFQLADVKKAYLVADADNRLKKVLEEETATVSELAEKKEEAKQEAAEKEDLNEFATLRTDTLHLSVSCMGGEQELQMRFKLPRNSVKEFDDALIALGQHKKIIIKEEVTAEKPTTENAGAAGKANKEEKKGDAGEGK